MKKLEIYKYLLMNHKENTSSFRVFLKMKNLLGIIKKEIGK
jgi:hypothetical protein